MKIITVDEFPTVNEQHQLEDKYNGKVVWIQPIPHLREWLIHIHLDNPKLDVFMGGKKK